MAHSSGSSGPGLPTDRRSAILSEQVGTARKTREADGLQHQREDEINLDEDQRGIQWGDRQGKPGAGSNREESRFGTIFEQFATTPIGISSPSSPCG